MGARAGTKRFARTRKVEAAATFVPNEVRIGVRLKHARMLRGYTLRHVADAAGCSESFISKLENDRASPSFAMLHRIAAILGANVAALFVADGEADHVHYRHDDRPVIRTYRLRPSKGTRLERLIPHSHSHLLQGNILHIAAGGASTGDIMHDGEEVGYVLQGEIELSVGGRRYRAKTGDSFHFRSNLPHGFRNLGREPARVLWINTPPTF